MNVKKHIAIFGAGPAGLTAAYELLKEPGCSVTVFELEKQVGGISRTIVYKNNRMDIGGHRFFSKSNTVMDWWQSILPLQGAPARDEMSPESCPVLSELPNAPDPEKEDRVMLIRSRLSRILYLRKFFDYPISLSWATVRRLGFFRMLEIGLSYIKACVFHVQPEKSLEDFFINRFGRKLYETFFRDYTEKVWGVPCNQISPDWGAQRVKGLSILGLLRHAWRGLFRKDRTVGQKNTETSLIEQFTYPKLGPGQLWEEVARLVEERGGKVLLSHRVTGLKMNGGLITGVCFKNLESGREYDEPCDYAISTLPIRELVPMLSEAPLDIERAAAGLVYRDFITVGVLAAKFSDKLTAQGETSFTIKDNWLYIQEPDVHMGRIQIFNNWSPYLVDDADRIWLGLEYFATEGDKLWSMQDSDFIQLAIEELEKIGIVDTCDILDSTMLRVKKAYPAYFGTYPQMPKVRTYLDSVKNLYPVGRNGMHRYNNADHSMLSAMKAVECIRGLETDKSVIWSINSEEEYHESK